MMPMITRPMTTGTHIPIGDVAGAAAANDCGLISNSAKSTATLHAAAQSSHDARCSAIADIRSGDSSPRTPAQSSAPDGHGVGVIVRSFYVAVDRRAAEEVEQQLKR